MNAELELFRDSELGISVAASGSHSPTNGRDPDPALIAAGGNFSFNQSTP